MFDSNDRAAHNLTIVQLNVNECEHRSKGSRNLGYFKIVREFFKVLRN